ncbi:zwei Ig domain protein zig-8-like [Palaemon carinicauda]|uniref:zwei Ig domain protein zig-8-like n=1 Tax=Palaemon carinicauda TaxID=392227 RepID=UPI0035B660D4
MIVALYIMTDIAHRIKGVLLLTFVLTLPEWTCGWSREGRHVVTEPPPPGPTMPPVFDVNTPTNVTVTATKTAMLSCIVHNLGNLSVSWIRHRDLHILSVGSQTFTTDSRFQAVPHEGTGDWLLRLRYAQTRDTGQYDCQVSSKPPTTRTTHLTVVEPQAKILRAPEMHVGLGSLINITCIVLSSPEPPDYLYWYHKEQILRSDGERISIRTHPGGSLSQLVVRDATAKDSGIYTCSPAHSKEDYIMVHVLTGEYPAAMQRGSSLTYGGRHCWTSVSVCLSVFLSTFVSQHSGCRFGFISTVVMPCVVVIMLTILHYFYM